VKDRTATPKRRLRDRIVRASVTSRRFDTHFPSAAVAFATARGDAHAIRIRAIRAILIPIGSSTTRFRELCKNIFLCPSVDESDANPASHARALARCASHHDDTVGRVSCMQEVRNSQGFLASRKNRRRIGARRQSVRKA